MGKKRHKRRHAHGGRSDNESASERSKSKSHRNKEAKVSKVGSYLSDYTKPMVIKRNEDGDTTEEEDADEEMYDVNGENYEGIEIISRRNR